MQPPMPFVQADENADDAVLTAEILIAGTPANPRVLPGYTLSSLRPQNEATSAIRPKS